jgi:hypothetical protein
MGRMYSRERLEVVVNSSGPFQVQTAFQIAVSNRSDPF